MTSQPLLTAERDQQADVDVPLRARGLVKRYKDLTAVAGVDLVVRRGDVFGLLGPNGAGKTTLMRMMLGLIRPDSGALTVFGRSVASEGISALRDVAGFVETPRFYPYLSGRSNLDLLSRLDRSDARGRVDEVLALVDLSARAHSRVREYSYGMVQRLGVAAALMRRPQLLVLDEPTNGLDPAGIREMRALVARLAGSGITVLLSSHNMSEVEETCHRVAIMRSGSIVYDGLISQLRERAIDVEHRLDTSDNDRAAVICHRVEGISGIERAYDGIRFDAKDSAVESLSFALSRAGIGIRRVFAPTSALETQFFRLTEQDAATEDVDAPTDDVLKVSG